MAPNMNQRRAVLNNTELVRRLQAVGEHRKASLLYHGTSGDAHAIHRGLRAAEQQGDHSAAQRQETQHDVAEFGANVTEGALGGSVPGTTPYTAVARIGHAKAARLGGEDVDGKRPQRYGLRVAPTFEQAIRTKVNKVSLPPLRATNFWNSPAYQALITQQQQVETDAELEARRAQLEALMKRVARERRVPLVHVREVVRHVISADTDDELLNWYQGDDDQDPPPAPPPRSRGKGQSGPRGQRGATGPQGPAGDPGDDGEDGMDGADGAQGPRGPRGFTGFPGDRGGQGPPGDLPEVASALRDLILYLREQQPSRPDEAMLPNGNGPPPPPPPPGGASAAVRRRNVRPREGDADAMEVATGRGGGPPPPPPPGGSTHYVLDAELLRTNRTLIEGMRHIAEQNRELHEAALEVENRRIAESNHQAAVSQEKHDHLIRTLQQTLNPQAAHIAAIDQGISSLHGAAENIAASSQAQAQSSNLAANQIVIAAQQAAEAIAAARRPDEKPFGGPEQPPGRRPLTARFILGPSEPSREEPIQETKRPAEAAASAETAIALAPMKAIRRMAAAAAPVVPIEDGLAPGFKAPVHISEIAPLAVHHGVEIRAIEGRSGSVPKAPKAVSHGVEIRAVEARSRSERPRSRSRTRVIEEHDESGGRPIKVVKEGKGTATGKGKSGGRKVKETEPSGPPTSVVKTVGKTPSKARSARESFRDFQRQTA